MWSEKNSIKTANLQQQIQFNRIKTVFFQYTQLREKNDERMKHSEKKKERKMYFVT